MNLLSFSTDYFPAAPIVPVQIARPMGAPLPNQYKALVDTGADGTFLPTHLLALLGTKIEYTLTVSSHMGEKTFEAPVHVIDLLLLGTILLPDVDVVAAADDTEIVLGRNVLNLLRIHLDGPNQTIQVTE